MGKEKEVVREQVKEQEQKEPVVQLEVHIKVYDNGQLGLDVPEGQGEVKPEQIEQLTKSVYEQLRDNRIAMQALEMFKSRLG